MKLTSDGALELLNKAEKITSDLGWISHSKCVGKTAGIIGAINTICSINTFNYKACNG